MIKIIQDYLKSFSDLFYPELCISCQKNEREVYDTFCIDCYSQLPFTAFQDYANNEFTEHFTGKIEIEMGNALFYFVKEGSIQDIIQAIKYKNKPHYAIKLGYIMGKSLFGKRLKNEIDIIIPVPLHLYKRRKRGYNQSYKFAMGLSDAIDKPVSTGNLIRIKNTSTQTKMNREQRIINLKNAFEVRRPKEYENKHILLVDDVLTTGSTLLECAKAIKDTKGIKISFATVAMGEPV